MKDQYYAEQLGTDHLPDFQEMSMSYVKTVQWICFYYFQHCYSWNHYYPHECAPFVSDFSDVHGMSFELSQPVKPFSHLLAILSTNSAQLLPKAYQPFVGDDMPDWVSSKQKICLSLKHFSMYTWGFRMRFWQQRIELILTSAQRRWSEISRNPWSSYSMRATQRESNSRKFMNRWEQFRMGWNEFLKHFSYQWNSSVSDAGKGDEEMYPTPIQKGQCQFSILDVVPAWTYGKLFEQICSRQWKTSKNSGKHRKTMKNIKKNILISEWIGSRRFIDTTSTNGNQVEAWRIRRWRGCQKVLIRNGVRRLATLHGSKSRTSVWCQPKVWWVRCKDSDHWKSTGLQLVRWSVER